MRQVALIGGIAAFFFGLIAMGVWMDFHEDQPKVDWCQARGYDTFKVKYQRLCVDPKTRLVYLPE